MDQPVVLSSPAREPHGGQQIARLFSYSPARFHTVLLGGFPASRGPNRGTGSFLRRPDHVGRSGLAGRLDRYGEPRLTQALLVELRKFLVARLRHRSPLRVRRPGNPRRLLHAHAWQGSPQPVNHPVDRVIVVVQDHVPGRLVASPSLLSGTRPLDPSCPRCRHVAGILPCLPGRRTLTSAFGRWSAR